MGTKDDEFTWRRVGLGEKRGLDEFRLEQVSWPRLCHPQREVCGDTIERSGVSTEGSGTQVVSDQGVALVQ